MFRSIKVLAPLALLVVACDEPADTVDATDTGETTTDDTDITTDDTDTTDDTNTTDTDTDTTSAAGWRVTSHPCFGNRTDTLVLEDNGDTAWVGCGTTTEGYGLFLTEDGGLTWSEPATNPAGFLENFRVQTISRSSDGLLYVGGINTLGSERVVSLDTSSTPYALAEVFTSTGQLWNSFQAGTFRRNDSGFAVAESLTGYDAAFRTGDDQAFQDGYGWWGGGNSMQILDMSTYGDDFYGCGSTISQPPQVYLPPPGGMGQTFSMVPVQLVTGLGAFDGEMWSLDVDADGVVVGGVNQGRNVGVIFTGPLDGYDTADWTLFDVSTIHGDDTTWIRGVCRSGQTILAAGEFSSLGTGLFLVSTDGGATFTDETPSGYGTVPPVHRCEILSDGRFVLTGAEGWYGVYTP